MTVRTCWTVFVRIGWYGTRLTEAFAGDTFMLGLGLGFVPNHQFTVHYGENA